MIEKFLIVIFILLVVILGVLLLLNSNTSSKVLTTSDKTVNNALTINIIAHRVSSGPFRSSRTHANIERVLLEAEKIWNQADIQFNFEIVDAKIDKLTEDAFSKERFEAVYALDYYQKSTINMFFISSIRANGIATAPSAAFINDVTSVNDFRATAHEIGHLLGLKHVFTSPTRLLYQGVNGAFLTPAEIKTARTNVGVFN